MLHWRPLAMARQQTVEEPDMRSKFLRCAFGAALAAGVAGSGGASLADEIVLATWGGKFGKLFQETWVDPFEQATGHEVKLIFGGGFSNSAQVIAQKDNPQIDLLTATTGYGADLWSRGLLEALDPAEIPNLSQLHELGVPRIDGQIPYAGLWLYSYVILYRTDKVDWPVTSWEDLWDERLENKVALPSPKHANSHFLAWMNQLYGSGLTDVEGGIGKLKTLGRNFVLQYDGSVQMMKPFAQGEMWAVPILSITANVIIGQGVPARYVIPEEGSVAEVDILMLVKNAPNGAAAKQFLNFIVDAKNLGRTCAGLRMNCLNTQVVPDADLAKVLLTDAQIAQLKVLDDGVINKHKAAWLEAWTRDMAPLTKR